jgi:hypothetical protein
MTYEELAKQKAPFRVKSIHSGGLAGWCLTFDLTKLWEIYKGPARKRKTGRPKKSNDR